MTLKSNSELSNRVYSVDPKKRNPPLHTGSNFKGSDGIEYHIISAQNIKEDGFQAMAVVPKINGKYDNNQIQIAYAGTNKNDWHDILADGTDINILNSWQGFGNHATKGQFKNADDFYKMIAKNYGEENIININGHSLGGALALYIAGINRKPAVTFSAANPTMYLTEDDIAWLKDNPELITNIYHDSDMVGGWLAEYGLGDSLLATKFRFKGDDGWFNEIVLNGHMLESYHFDKNGNLVMQPEEELKFNMIQLKGFYKKLKTNGLTDSEKIYLDSAEALVVASGLSRIAEDGIDKIIKKYQDTIDSFEPLWQRTLTSADSIGQHLNQYEITNALEQGGLTHKTVVDDPTTELESNIAKAKVVRQDYIDLSNKIKDTVQSKIEVDEQLAGLFVGL